MSRAIRCLRARGSRLILALLLCLPLLVQGCGGGRSSDNPAWNPATTTAQDTSTPGDVEVRLEYATGAQAASRAALTRASGLPFSTTRVTIHIVDPKTGLDVVAPQTTTRPAGLLEQTVVFKNVPAGAWNVIVECFNDAGTSLGFSVQPVTASTSGAARVTVTSSQALNALAVSPTTATVAIGATQAFTATGTFADGSTASMTASVTWSSSSTATATVSNDVGKSGTATGVKGGTATIAATAADKTAAATITVKSALLPGVATSGDVTTIVRAADGTTYIGGAFDLVGSSTGGLVPVDVATGTWPDSFAMVDGVVIITAPDGRGGWYIGGNFKHVGGQARRNLAHIQADGTVDPAWNPGADGPVWAMAASGQKVAVGGRFQNVGGQPRPSLAVLDATTGAALAWNPAPNSQVSSMAVVGSTLYVAGQFTQIDLGGTSYLRNRLAAFDIETGAISDTWKPSADDGPVMRIVAGADRIYAAGNFATVNGNSHQGVVAVGTDGTVLPWDPGLNGGVYGLAVSGTTLYVGGDFTSVGGQGRNRLAAFDTTSGALGSWNPGADRYVYTLAVSGNTVYAGGEFTTIGGTARNYLAALDATTGQVSTWNPSPTSIVQNVTVSGTTAWVGGWFAGMGAVPRHNVAAFDASGKLLAFNPGPDYAVRKLLLSGTTLYMGGMFTKVGGVDRALVAAVDATTGALKGWNPVVTGNDVYALALSGSTLYVGGNFTEMGGANRVYLGAVDTGTGLAVDAFNANIGDGPVRSLLVDGSTLYAGGDFTTVGGQARGRGAALDSATGALKGWNPEADATIYCMALNGTTLYVGGSFRNIGGQARPALAAFDTPTGLLSAWNPAPSAVVKTTPRALAASVRSLAFNGNTVYVGGYFASIGGQARTNLAAVDATTALATDFNPALSGNVYALLHDGVTLFAGGNFPFILWEGVRAFGGPSVGG